MCHQDIQYFNKIKNRTEKNVIYKKIFRIEDHPQKDCASAKFELPNILSLIGLPKEKKEDEETMREIKKYQKDR